MSATMTEPSASFAATSPIPMSRIVKVELRKMMDTRAGFWLMVIIGAATAIIDVILLIIAAAKDNHFALFDFVTVPSVALGILLPVLGVMAVTSESSQRTAMVTYALVPQRSRVLVAKLIAVLVAGVGAIVSAVVVGVVANLIYGVVGPDGTTWNFGIANLGAFLLLMLIALLIGFGLGVLIMNTPAAIVLYFVYNFVLPGLLYALSNLSSFFDKAVPWIDLNRSTMPLQNHDLTDINWGHIVVGALIWIGIPLAIGARRMIRSEVK